MLGDVFGNAPRSGAQRAGRDPGRDPGGGGYRRGTPSHEIRADLYHQVLICPFKLLRVDTPRGDAPAGKGATEQAAPKPDSPIALLVEELERAGQVQRIGDTGTGAPWRERCFFPFDPTADHPVRGESALSREMAHSRIRFAEYVYFHPPVRRFLYPTVEDGEGAPATPDTPNKTMRVFERTDARWARVQYQAAPHDNAPPELMTRLLRVRRMELYLFNTDVAMFVVELDNRLGPNGYSETGGVSFLDSFREPSDHPYDVARGKPEDWGFDTGDFACIKELAGVPPTTLSLHDVQTLQDAVRRVHAPYWEWNRDDNRLRAGHSIRRLDWLRIENASSDDDQRVQYLHAEEAAGKPGWKAEPPEGAEWTTDDAQGTIEGTRGEGEPKLLPWWDAVLPFKTADKEFEYRAYDPGAARPNGVSSPPSSKQGEPRVQGRLLGDDRMTVLTYLGVEDPRAIGDGDWMRLAFQDDPGPADRFPYSPDFYGSTAVEAVRAFESLHAYDRHYSASDESPSSEHQTTRRLCSAMGMVSVGESRVAVRREQGGRQESLRPFFADPVNGELAHFRYHYFKIALILHFQRATLLKLEDDLAMAVGRFLHNGEEDAEEQEAYSDAVQSLGMRLLTFRNRYVFNDVTSQVQGQELFDQWGSQLGVDGLLESVSDDLEAASAGLTRLAEKVQAARSMRLAKIANYYLPIAVTFPLLQPYLPAPQSLLWWLAMIGAGLIVAAGFDLSGEPGPVYRLSRRSFSKSFFQLSKSFFQHPRIGHALFGSGVILFAFGAGLSLCFYGQPLVPVVERLEQKVEAIQQSIPNEAAFNDLRNDMNALGKATNADAQRLSQNEVDAIDGLADEMADLSAETVQRLESANTTGEAARDALRDLSKAMKGLSDQLEELTEVVEAQGGAPAPQPETAPRPAGSSPPAAAPTKEVDGDG